MREYVIQEAKRLVSEKKYYIKEISSYEEPDLKTIKKILKIYEEKLDSKTLDHIKEYFKNGDLYAIAYDRKTNEPVAFCRYFEFNKIKNPSKKKRMHLYNEILKIKNFIFIADLASIAPGAGKTVIQHVNKKAKLKKLPIVLIPWSKQREKLINYYSTLGFKEIRFNIKGFPRILMVKQEK